MKRREYVGAGAIAAIGALSGCLSWRSFTVSEATEVVEGSFASTEVRDVRITNAVGDVTVVAQGTGGVDARVRKRSGRGQSGLDDVSVRMAVEDGVLRVETEIDRGAFLSSQTTPTTDVTVTVPGSGPGPAVSSVGSDIGTVTLLGTRGDAVVRTDVGEIVASGVDGYLTLSSRVGTVLASDVAGLDSVHTDVGDIKVDLLGLRGDVDIGTDVGSVTVGVADDLDLDLLAETNGSLDSNLPLINGRTVGSRLTGRIGAGGHRLHAFSDLGDVSLRSISRGASA